MSGYWITRVGAGKVRLRFIDQSGFTLVETIVAAVILFTCSAAAALSYNTAVNLARKLNATIAIATVIPDTRDQIREQLFEGKFQGEFAIPMNPGELTVSWQAVDENSALTVAGLSETRANALERGNFRIFLYRVDLMGMIGTGEFEYSMQYTYTELVWQKV
jgi:prepilin-type N-terminal cleavage/methylation domain-containing protein